VEPRIRVLIADDDLVYREGLKNVLKSVEDIEIVGEASTAQQTIQMTCKIEPDVVLMDLRWFGDDSAGITAVAQIKQKRPKTKVVAITVYRHLIAEARKAGADAAITKGFSISDLINIIRPVHELEPAPKEERPKKTVDHSNPAYLAAAIGIPTLGFVVVAAELMWAVQSVSTEKFLVAVIPSMIFYFFGVIFAGRYVDIISETTTYRLFLRVLNIFRVKLPLGRR